MSAALSRSPGFGLERIAALATEIDAPAIAAAARRWSDRVAEGLFYVACVGQFKRGKSTLLNALIQRELLPSGVVPVTTVVTVIRFGKRPAATVRTVDGRVLPVAPEGLAAYVSEEGNPRNEKGISLVEVFVPSAILASGMCLIDTPGLGSISLASDATTHEFVPHIDAALVVLGADPPISGEELGLVRELAAHVRDFLFVMNKTDRLAEEERRSARAFSERVLSEALGRTAGPLFEVSAIEQMRGGGGICSRNHDWAALRQALGSLASASGGALVQAAAGRGLERLGEQLRREIGTRREVLLQPVEASERRIAELHRWVEEAERSLEDLGYLLQGEQDRIAEALARRRARFLAEAIPDAHHEVCERLGAPEGRSRLGLRRAGVRIAAQVAMARFERWRREEAPVVEDLYRRAGRRFALLANQLLARLASYGDPAFANLPEAVSEEAPLWGRARFSFQALEWLARPHLGERMLDVFFPHGLLRRRVERRLRGYLRTLFEMTSMRIHNDFLDRLLESRRRLEGELRASFAEIHGALERALGRARRVRAEGVPAVERELTRLAAFEAELGQSTEAIPPSDG